MKIQGKKPYCITGHPHPEKRKTRKDGNKNPPTQKKDPPQSNLQERERERALARDRKSMRSETVSARSRENESEELPISV